jgi:hypothetical protein
MMQTSIKEIVEGIKNVAQVYFSDEIKFVSFNQFPTASFDKNCIGLIYYIDSYPSSVNTSKVSIRFEFLDLINTMSDIDESKLEAFSDTQGVGEGFVQYLDRNGYRIDEAVTKTKIEPKTNNGVGGTEFIVTFNYLKDCFITGDGYKFKALTIGKTIDSDSNFLVNIADVTENNSGLTGLFKFASTPDSDLNVTINEAKTQLTIQTDVGTTRFSNLNFTASNGIVDSSAVIVNSIAYSDSFSFGNALKTSSGTEFVNFPSGLTALDSAANISLHLWINKQSGNYATFGSAVSSNNRLSLIFFTDNNLYLTAANGASSFGVVDFTPYLGLDTCVSLVYDGTKTGNSNRLKCYINGVDISLTYGNSIPATVSNSISTAFTINKSNSPLNIGIGKYDELLITTDSSTLTQHQAFYNSGNGALATDCYTNILAFWRCNQVDGDTTLIDSVGTATGNLNNFVAPYFIPFV